VTKHRRSGRWEAHVWVREEGKQAYLGGRAAPIRPRAALHPAWRSACERRMR